MPDRPILFSAPMVRALLDGRKTQTRRALKFQPAPGISIVRKTIRPMDTAPYHAFERRSLYGNYAGELDVKVKRGDRLWVRESVIGEELDSGLDGVRYLADDAFIPIQPDPSAAIKWLELHTYRGHSGSPIGKPVPSIHMPRWVSRITLIVTDVRVERLQDISEADAIAEGVVAGKASFDYDSETGSYRAEQDWYTVPGIADPGCGTSAADMLSLIHI